MITSTGNQNVKEVVQLRKKSKARAQAGVFLVEGLRMIQEVPPERLKKLYVTEEFYRKHGENLGIQLPEEDQKKAGAEKKASGQDCGSGENIRSGVGKLCAELVSDTVFSYMSDTKAPQGVLGIVEQARYRLEDVLGRAAGMEAAPNLLILDNLQDPGNLGTIFRTAEAAGVSGIVMSSDCVDIYNPKTIRSTMGAVYRMPFLYVEDMKEMLHLLNRHNIRIYAAHLEGTNTYDQEDYRGGTAFLIGNEGNGLRQEIAACADTWIRIPMAGQAESLNAAVAAAVLMYETARQRRG